MDETEKPKQRRGFAVMSPERRREYAARGGAAVKPENRAFSQNRELAVKAGQMGGRVSRKSPKNPVAEAPMNGDEVQD